MSVRASTSIVTIDDSFSSEDARAEIERMARDVLANPIIEDYLVEMDSDCLVELDSDS